MLALPLAFSQSPYGYQGAGSYQSYSNQDYATSRPQQADPSGSSYQSMSPDSWGSSAPSGPTPAQGPSYAGPNGSGFNPGAYATTPYGTSPHTPQRYPLGPNSYQPSLQAGTATPNGNRPTSPSTPSQPFYQDTGAPSIETMLGGRDDIRPGANRSNVFQPADFDQQDPRDLPLAPTVPSSTGDDRNNSFDMKTPVAAPRQQNQPPQQLELLSPATESLPIEGSTDPSVLTEVEGSLNLPPQSTSPQTKGSYSIEGSESSSSSDRLPPNALPGPVPSTPYAPFEPRIQQQAQPTFQPQVQPQVQTQAQPLAPYQMPEVFNQPAITAPAQTHLIETTPGVPVQFQQSTPHGFGWGNAPGLFGRMKQKRQQQPPTYRQQQPIEPQHGPFSQHPNGQERSERSGPRFPLPFGIGSRQGQAEPTFQPTGHVPHLPPQGQQGPARGQPIPQTQPNRQFRPDLGQRAPLPTVRNFGTYDSGREVYDFENKKKEFPPFSEILATGRWFGNVEAQLLTPRFNGSTDLLVADNTTAGQPIVTTRAFDYDGELAPVLRFGFESKYGPGFQINYRQLNAGSESNQFASAGAVGAAMEFPIYGSTNSLTLDAFGAGETISAQHSFKLENFGFSVFKEVQLPVTRITGLFGFQYANITHRTVGEVESGGAVIRSGNSTSDIRALGPRLRIEYFRPVGHTPLEFITSFGGSLMFGKRDHFVTVTDSGSFTRRDVDELLTTVDFLTGIQIRKRLNETDSVFARISFINQSYNNGGSAGQPDDDFGLRGFSFLAGLNR